MVNYLLRTRFRWFLLFLHALFDVLPGCGIVHVAKLVVGSRVTVMPGDDRSGAERNHCGISLFSDMSVYHTVLIHNTCIYIYIICLYIYIYVHSWPSINIPYKLQSTAVYSSELSKVSRCLCRTPDR